MIAGGNCFRGSTGGARRRFRGSTRSVSMIHVLHSLSGQSRVRVLLLGLVLVGLVGLIDYQTYLSVEILYLVPIGLATWSVGRRAGMLMAGLSGVIMLMIDV